MADSLFHQATYPFHLAVARELHLALVQLYPSSKATLFAGQKAGVDAFMINGDQAPYMVWKDLLELACLSGLLRPLVQMAVTDFPASPRRAFLDALLADAEPPVALEPRMEDGTPAFRRLSDEVTLPEALLFHDDLSLPVGRIAWLIGVLQSLAALAPGVCKLEVACAIGVGAGTGFRIAPNLLLTNHHVLYPEGRAPSAITATFGYEDDGQGGGLSGTSIACDIASIRADEAGDWGVVATLEALPAGIPTIALAEAAVPTKDGLAFIVQHPGGQRKRVAYTRNRISFVDDRVVQYLSDTEVGSSGSPVFDAQGRLVALHHAGGRPQEVAGQAPLKKNEGMRIEPILRGLRDAGLHF